MPATTLAMTRGAAGEEYHSTAYFYDNARRPDADSLVIQLTLAGAAFITGPEGITTAPVGHPILFTRREKTCYGYPPEATTPYRLRFVAITRAVDAEVMFDRIRDDFGRVVRMPRGSTAANLFDELYSRSGGAAFADRLEEAELIYRLLIAIYREQVSGVKSSDPIAWGYHLLRDRFRQPVNINELARAAGISREHFIRRFTARFGEAPGVMLRKLRLEYARGLLQATEAAVEDVAIASGFAGSNTFCRAYRRHFGRSPSSERPRR